MSNERIIAKAKAELIENNLIGADEDIFTRRVWRDKGFKVNKWETPIATLPISICVKSTNEENKMIPVHANFYTRKQVKEIRRRA